MMQQRPPQSPEETRNLILALVLAALVMFGWQYVFNKPDPHKLAAQRAEQQAQQQPVSAPQPAATPAIQPQPALQSRAEALQDTARVRISSPALHGSINLRGARFDDLTLVEYKQTVEDTSPEVVLLTPKISGEGYFAEFGWVGQGIQMPDATTLWQADADKLTPQQPVTLSWVSPQQIRFSLDVAVDKDFMFTITRRVENASGQAITFAPYSLINRTLNEQEQAYLILHQGPLGVSDEILHEVDYDDLAKGKITYTQSDGWTGITDKYWLTSLIPSEKTEEFTTSYHNYQTEGDQRYQTDILSQPRTLAAGEVSQDVIRFFAGAKKLDLLDGYEKKYNITLFERSVDFGILYFLTRPIFEALQFLYGILGNFGLAILALTVIIKAIMFPLANKSYGSMSQMKLLMPKMKEIRERYSDDRIKMNQEIMAMYKQEGVNPAAGCLPMLLQIPVFFSLYKVLFITIEMRHAPFYGWIEDLSAKDPTNIFTLFGTIPWDPPNLLHVGLWPLIMTATMVIQQRLNPKPADPTQAQVMQYLPYMFLFMFASFPAGLVLYWAWNNTLSIIQQYLITKRFEKIYDKETGKRFKPARKVKLKASPKR